MVLTYSFRFLWGTLCHKYISATSNVIARYAKVKKQQHTHSSLVVEWIWIFLSFLFRGQNMSRSFLSLTMARLKIFCNCFSFLPTEKQFESVFGQCDVAHTHTYEDYFFCVREREKKKDRGTWIRFEMVWRLNMNVFFFISFWKQ